MSFSSPERVLTAIYVFTFGGFAFCGLMNVTITNKMFDKVKKFTKGGKQIENFLRESFIESL